MCGICGYLGGHDSLGSERLRLMNDRIMHRGPDEDGYYLSKGVGLAMRRLSILDLAYGTQPIFNEENNICTVFNGEIYNYKELVDVLKKKGHVFRTHSDTEVIVHLYEEYGDDFVQHLRGMFAIALWDDRKSRLVVVRDRLGIKPLFYSLIDGNFVFGSEIKSVLSSGLVSKEMNYQALDAYFTYTYIPAPYTIYTNISKLEPGHMIIADRDGLKIKQYWDLDFSDQDNSKSESEWEAEFDSAIYDAVQSHLVSDVPLGAFLSGGIDSSLIAAMMTDVADHDIETFTMSFNEESASLIDERIYAKMMADQYPLKYNEFSVSPNFESVISGIVEAFDEPFADDSVVPSFYISQLTRKKVKVALSGLGGDELFAGYHRYFGFYLSSLYDYVPKFLHRGIVSPLINNLFEPKNSSDRIDHAKRFMRYADMLPANRYLGYVSTMNELERQQLFSSEVSDAIDYQKTSNFILSNFERCQSDDLMDKMLYTDIKTYLPDDVLALSDRLSMCHSLELRVPFVDHKLVELSAKMPSKFKINLFGKKRLLKKVAEKWVPRAVISHRKQGFESPMAGWLKNELYEYTNQLLSESNLEKIGLFNYKFVKNKLDAHFSGKEKNNKIIFSLIMFVLWYQHDNK